MNWDRDKLERFKKAYALATETKNDSESFFFDGCEFLIAYARYLIEYLEAKLA